MNGTTRCIGNVAETVPGILAAFKKQMQIRAWIPDLPVEQSQNIDLK